VQNFDLAKEMRLFILFLSYFLLPLQTISIGDATNTPIKQNKMTYEKEV